MASSSWSTRWVEAGRAFGSGWVSARVSRRSLAGARFLGTVGASGGAALPTPRFPKGREPVSISCSSTPKANRSVRASPVSSRHCSGAM